ncbi:MAG: hypothetical protein RLZZ542_584 [Pseudomonadota bacterium]
MTNHLIEDLRSSGATNQPGKDWFAPLSGWLLSTLVVLEEDCGGTLLFAYKAGPVWRNSVAVAVATGNLDHHPQTFLLRAYGSVDESRDAPSLRAQFAKAIQTMTPRQIVEAALDVLPPSLCGSLKKIGNEPLTTAEAYRRLVDLLGSTNAEDRTRRRVLEQVNERLTDNLLQVIETVDLAVLTPTVVTRIHDAGDAHRLNARLRAIRQLCSTANDQSLRESADAMGSNFNAGSFARSWLARADRLEPLGLPIDDALDVIRINPAKAEDWGRRFRNCVSSYASEMAAGASAFFVIEALSVIVVLRLTDAGWMLVGVHTHGNGPVPRAVVETVKEKLCALGVLCILPVKPKGPAASAISGFRRDTDWEFEFEGMGAWD